MVQSYFITMLSAAIGAILLIGSTNISLAQMMQSTNYKIQSDSINVGGGLSSSTNFVSESTIGEVATGDATSTNYSLKAGYQQMNEVYIAISTASDVSLSPSIPGVGGGISNGSTTVTVTTDSIAGYSLSISASTSPSMQKGADFIADYIPASAPTPDFSFSTGVSQSHFGYSPEGVNVVQVFKDNGSSCNVGSLYTASACWKGLATSPFVIASAASSNHPLGATTTVRFRVGVGSNVVQPEGIYTATTTLTAIAL